MEQQLKTFADGVALGYGHGKFDAWCVYLRTRDGRLTAPTDVDCFARLRRLGERHGSQQVYRDFARVYDRTGQTAESSVLREIGTIATAYGRDALLMDKALSVLYLAMVAEERKQGTRLGKRIKRLGVHSLLLEGRTVEEAAHFTRGMNWRTIDRLCQERGF